jgi:hypothetical protein
MTSAPKRREDLRRLPRPGQVARVDDVDVSVRDELLGKSLRLRATALVQRDVGMSLPAAVGVPVGLAVANEEERGHD